MMYNTILWKTQRKPAESLSPSQEPRLSWGADCSGSSLISHLSIHMLLNCCVHFVLL